MERKSRLDSDGEAKHTPPPHKIADAHAHEKHRKVEQDRKLHDTLKDSFPASDPPSTGQVTGREEPKSRIDKPAAPVIPPDVHPEHKRK